MVQFRPWNASVVVPIAQMESLNQEGLGNISLNSDNDYDDENNSENLQK